MRRATPRSGRLARSPSRRSDARGFTFVEVIVSLSLAMLLAAFLYPAFTRALRTTFQVTSRAGLQSGLRLLLENVVRDTHRAHVVLAGGTDGLDLFLSDTAETPEVAAEATRADPAGLPAFPFSGTFANAPLEGDRRLVLPGRRISYRRAAQLTVSRTERSGRLVGVVKHDESAGRSAVSTWLFEPSGEDRASVLATDVRTFAVALVAYRPSGCLARAAPDQPWTAAGLALSLTGSVLPEADRKDEPGAVVEERLVTRAWLSRRLSEAVHDHAAAAFDERTEE